MDIGNDEDCIDAEIEGLRKKAIGLQKDSAQLMAKCGQLNIILPLLKSYRDKLASAKESVGIDAWVKDLKTVISMLVTLNEKGKRVETLVESASISDNNDITNII